MKIDDILLMAYVDGELAPPERQQVESEISASPEVAERVALFEATCLPYREAFAHQKLPPLPDTLVKKIEQMAHTHAVHPVKASANDPTVSHDEERLPPSAPVRSRLRVAPAWLAVAFVAGAFCCGAVLRFAPGVSPGLNPMLATVASGTTGASSWIQAAAGYQRLYARETVEQVSADAAGEAKTVEEIRRDDGLALRVPDLREAGLTFKRVQRLRFNGRPLIQIVYLPEKGEPVALCVIKDMKPDQTVTTQRVDDMNVVTWRQAELGYALIGNSNGNGVDLTALAKRISDRSVDELFETPNSSAPGATPYS
jgi:anti-sigma factor RsiW